MNWHVEGSTILLLPERANYFEDPSLLIFDANCPINIQFGHILNDPNNIKKTSKKKKKMQLTEQRFLEVPWI